MFLFVTSLLADLPRYTPKMTRYAATATGAKINDEGLKTLSRLMFSSRAVSKVMSGMVNVRRAVLGGGANTTLCDFQSRTPLSQP